MKYYDENEDVLDIEQLKKELQNMQGEMAPTESDLETELEVAYQHANQQVTGMADINFAGIGKKLLKKIKSAICAIVGPDSSSDDIIDAILDALIALIPGGLLIKPLIKKLAKYIFDKGIGSFCAVN
jgi:hypothetical protein